MASTSVASALLRDGCARVGGLVGGQVAMQCVVELMLLSLLLLLLLLLLWWMCAAAKSNALQVFLVQKRHLPSRAGLAISAIHTRPAGWAIIAISGVSKVLARTTAPVQHFKSVQVCSRSTAAPPACPPSRLTSLEKLVLGHIQSSQATAPTGLLPL